jgi:ATP-binding cassette subfamily B protein
MAPSILVVDEGTSSLDGALERRTLQAIDTLLPQATRIVVSHRALDVAAFDLVIDFPRKDLR